MPFPFPVLGTFDVPKNTQTAGTAIASLIPPYRGRQGWGAGSAGPGIINLTTVVYTTTGTAHDLVFMRPFNYTTTSAAAAASQAVIVLTEDPGSYSTAYNYRTPGDAAPRTANNLIAANDYVVVQLPDGTYLMDTVSSVSTLSVTLANNLPTGGVAAGALVWFFGVAANTDPATALANPSITLAADVDYQTVQDTVNGIWHTLHAGDPAILYSANGTNAGTLSLASGFYHKL